MRSYHFKSILQSGYCVVVMFLALTQLSFAQEQKTDTTQLGLLLASPEAQSDLNYALLTAAANGDSLQICWLLKYGAEIETKTSENVTPLIFAVANNREEAARILINNGANPNVKTYILETPLTLAVKNDNLDIAEMLIRDSAIVNEPDRYGATALHYAALYGYLKTADMLLYYDAQVSCKSFDGTTPLMAAAWSGYTDIADLLIQNGAKCSERDNDGFTPFLIAAQNGDTVMMEYLLRNGSDLYEVNRYKYNALDLAIKVSSSDAVDYLLKKGDKWGESINKSVNPFAVATIYQRNSFITVMKEQRISGGTVKGFDQVSLTASVKNCIFDYYTGFSASFKEPRFNLGLIAGLDFKPGYTRILIKKGESLYYQYYDKGAMAYAGIFKDIRITDNPLGGNWFLTGSLSCGYSFSNKLKGTEAGTENKFRLIPEAGVKWNKGAFTLDTEIEYMNTDFYKIGPLWLRIGFSWSFFFNNARAPAKVIKW